MRSRDQFLQALNDEGQTHEQRAVALLWYYRQSQEFEERTPSDLATDLQDAGFPTPNVTRLRDALRRSRDVVRGRRPGTFQVNARRIAVLDDRYRTILGDTRVTVNDSVLPAAMVTGSRPYLERIVYQINGAYEYGFYDCAAVLCRRLVESLIIEIYIHGNRQDLITHDRIFVSLDRLISVITQDKAIQLARGTPRALTNVKQVGDAAAHDRTYITNQLDIDDLKAQYRRLVAELLHLAAITPAPQP